MGVRGLGKTGQSYAEQWYKEQFFKRRKEFTSKYTNKGNIMEDNSIDFVTDQLGLGFVLKNDKYFENEFMTGTPDVILPDMIIDVKNSWDCFTFPLLDTSIPDSDYYWQAQCYMHLTGIKKYKLCYVLSDTPIHLIEKEAFYYCKNNGYDGLDVDVYENFVAKMTYPDIDDKHKLKVYDIDYNPDESVKIQDRVIECRSHLDKIL